MDEMKRSISVQTATRGVSAPNKPYALPQDRNRPV